MIEIAIVRHGETKWNQEERMQGHRDISLNENGLRQAALIAKRLSEQSWDAVISSDLKRAAVTADTIAAASNIDIVKRDGRLRERHFGRLEGTTPADRVREWGADWESMDHGAEDPEALFQRAMEFLDEAVVAYQGKRIIVVTHGGWIRQVFGRLFPLLDVGRPGNTAFSLIRHVHGQWTYSLYNCTEHLGTE